MKTYTDKQVATEYETRLTKEYRKFIAVSDLLKWIEERREANNPIVDIDLLKAIGRKEVKHEK